MTPFNPKPFVLLTRGLAPKQFQYLIALADGLSLKTVDDTCGRMFKVLKLEGPHETQLARLTRIAVAAGLVEV